jgi:hypothetical protein
MNSIHNGTEKDVDFSKPNISVTIEAQEFELLNGKAETATKSSKLLLQT